MLTFSSTMYNGANYNGQQVFAWIAAANTTSFLET